MILCGSENVYTIEVENVLKQIPGVKQVCVVGVPDKTFGQKVKCLIVSQKKYSPKDIFIFCKKYLAHYKIPRIVENVDTLPMSGSLKIKKHWH